MISVGWAGTEPTTKELEALFPQLLEPNTETEPELKLAGKVIETFRMALSTVKGFPVRPKPLEMTAPCGAVQRYEVAFGIFSISYSFVVPPQTPTLWFVVEVVDRNLVFAVRNPMAYTVLELLVPKQLDARTEIHVAINPASYLIDIEFVPCPEMMVAFPKPVNFQE